MYDFPDRWRCHGLLLVSPFGAITTNYTPGERGQIADQRSKYPRPEGEGLRWLVRRGEGLRYDQSRPDPSSPTLLPLGEGSQTLSPTGKVTEGRPPP